MKATPMIPRGTEAPGWYTITFAVLVLTAGKASKEDGRGR
jgi:hypothetical protein